VKILKITKRGCPHFERGICGVWRRKGEVLYCPPERAEFAGSECCHTKPLKLKVKVR